jgi:hypothetical protein
MDALSQINVKDDPGPFKRAEDRWKPYLDDPGPASAFAGPVLTHSDWTPDNVLVSERRAWLIDWACTPAIIPHRQLMFILFFMPVKKGILPRRTMRRTWR